MPSFSKLFTSLWLLVLSAALTSCIKPAKGTDDANNGSTFIVQTVTGKSQAGLIPRESRWEIVWTERLSAIPRI